MVENSQYEFDVTETKIAIKTWGNFNSDTNQNESGIQILIRIGNVSDPPQRRKTCF